MASKPADPTTAYARDVVSGAVPAGHHVRLACRRHLEDLDRGAERGLRFDAAAAKRVFDFFSLLRHSKGRWAGAPFDLQPWQKFVVGSLFGWKKSDGTRRFGVGHVEVGRKNGKTTLASGIGLALLVLDGEAGAEVYTCATKKDQAKLAHEESKRMVGATAGLKQRLVVYKDNINHPGSGSKYEPLSADGHKLDGLNASGAIMDELHAWKNRLLWDVMETSTGARDQPLFFVTTTAGYDRHGIWWERRELALKVLSGLVSDDSLFAYVATLDAEDDWKDPAVWVKGNPSLGVTVRVEELAKRCEEAQATPGKQNAFKRLRLNVPTDQAELWLDLDRWDRCRGDEPLDEAGLRGRPCFAGLDLSATTDLSALALLFPPSEEGERWKLLVRFWLPGDDLQQRCERDNVSYDVWADQGLVTLTAGNVIDYDVIEAQIKRDAETFELRELAFDRYFANQLVLRLMDEGLEVVAFGQGFASMAGPTKEFEALVAAGNLDHGGNPVLRWQAGNAAVRQDPAGNRKPDKKASNRRIDGLVATLMALGRAMLASPEQAEARVEVWG